MNISPAGSVNVFETPAASDSARENRRTWKADADLGAARTAVDALKRRPNELAGERKVLARRKVEQLKARLLALQSMASADPKGTPRLAAQLTRELTAAIKAYAATGGATQGLSATVPALPTNPAGSTGAATSSETLSADGAADQVADDGSGGGDERAEVDPPNPYQQIINEAKAKAVEMIRQGKEFEDDAKFDNETRKMTAHIKVLIRQALDRSPDDHRSSSDAREAARALADLDEALADAETPGVGVSLLA